MNAMTAYEDKHLKKDVTPFNIGDTVKVHLIIKEAENKERIQVFQGDVIARRGTGLGATFTVRKVSFGVGVEKIFPVHSRTVKKVEVVKRSKVRRAKLYYLRELKGKAARLKQDRS